MEEVRRILRTTPLHHPPTPPPWTKHPSNPPSTLPTITQRAIDIYLLSQQSSGEMGGIGWWQSANGYTAMSLHDIWSNTNPPTNYATLATAIKTCESNHRGLINEFNDDSLWWAMLCVHMYSLQHDEWFLKQARGVWAHILRSAGVCKRGQYSYRSQDMEGACFWTTRKGEEQVNTISTGLFAELSVRLALLCESNSIQVEGAGWSHWGCLQRLFGRTDAVGPSRKEYIAAAERSLAWILRCRFRVEEGVVLDGIMLKQQRSNDWTFTYTTGVTIGSLALLYQATREEEYLILACHMANQAMRRTQWVEDNGVLTESGAYGKDNHDALENDDAVGFKAVLMRHLAVLYQVVQETNVAIAGAQETAALVKTFVNINLQSQLERNTNGNDQYGPWWNGSFDTPTSHSQMAALDVMAAARLVNG